MLSDWDAVGMRRSRHGFVDLLLVQTELALPVCESACHIDAVAGLGIAPFYQGGDLGAASICFIALEAIWLFVIVVDGAAHNTRASGKVGGFGIVVWQDGRDDRRARSVVFLLNWEGQTRGSREACRGEVVGSFGGRRGRTRSAL